MKGVCAAASVGTILVFSAVSAFARDHDRRPGPDSPGLNAAGDEIAQIVAAVDAGLAFLRSILPENSPVTFTPQNSRQARARSGRSSDGALGANPEAVNSIPDPGPVKDKPELDGFCPVELLDNERWRRGDAEQKAVYRGRTYLFSSQDAREKFLAAPEKYAPVFDGDDLVVWTEEGKRVPGRREDGFYYKGRVFLFSSSENAVKFNRSPADYAGRAGLLPKHSLADRFFEKDPEVYVDLLPVWFLPAKVHLGVSLRTPAKENEAKKRAGRKKAEKATKKD